MVLPASEPWATPRYSISELVSAYCYRTELIANMDAFVSSLHVPTACAQAVVEEFNNRIRLECSLYAGFPHMRDFGDLPITSKPQLRMSLRSARFDPASCWLKRTTGSTGPPLHLFYTDLFHHETTLLTVPKIARRLGLAPPDDHIFNLTIRDKPGQRVLVRFDPSGCGGTSIRVGINTGSQSDLSETLALIQRVKPFCLSSSPSLLRALCDYASSQASTVRAVPLVVSGGATLDMTTRSQLQALFQGAVCSAYGLSETGVIASECIRGRMHFNTSDCCPEILVEDGTVRAAGDFMGEILLTSVRNSILPIIRYRTGDVGRLSFDDCPCGERSPVLAELSGRVIPLFRLPSGRVFCPTQFREAFGRFAWLKEFQVVQVQADKVRVLYERSDGHLLRGVEAVNFRAYFLKEFGTEITVELEAANLDGTGKFQRYITYLD